jgi:hypothetical protein
MPLQNRVAPDGTIHADASRGLFTGNRGIIHDPQTRALVRRGWTTKAWIVCSLDHPRGRTRIPMGCNGPDGRAGWTELFFLDEVTALSAGHRPCFYCRRDAAIRFATAYARGNGMEGATAPIMDALLHAQRTRREERPTLLRHELGDLPDGAMLADEEGFVVIHAGRCLRWSFSGYRTVEPAGGMRLVTPESAVNALRAGFSPVWHETARA